MSIEILWTRPTARGCIIVFHAAEQIRWEKDPFGQLQCLCYVHNTARELASDYRTRVELPAPPLPCILTFGGLA